MPDRFVILTGFMGTGKSSVAKLVAQSLGLPLVDLDQVIVESAGRAITQIFTDEGEDGFREIERHCLERLLAGTPAVVATGGGVVISAENRRLMRSAGVVVNLTASLGHVLKRIEGCTDRPLLAGGDTETRMKNLMEQRELFYKDADIRIDTDGKSVEDVAAEILNYCKELSA